MLNRSLAQSIRLSMQDTPVVVLNGARQTGKSTLLKSLANTDTRYYTLDDPAALAAASSDPSGFVSAQTTAVMIDEVQRAPGLFLAIKHAVDQLRTPGRFVLSGSANVLLLPKLADSLAGRMEILTLWPLSQSEIEGTGDGGRHNLVDALFAAPGSWLDQLHGLQPDLGDLRQRLDAGGYPEAISRSTEGRRNAWFAAYLQTILQRDIRDLAQIDGLTQLPQLVSQLAHKATGMLNTADLSRTLGLPQTTLKRYLTLLQTVYLVSLLPAWAPRASHRAQKTPKLYFNDSGLLAHLLGLGTSKTTAEPTTGLHGAVLETFVFAELQKLLGWAQTPAQLMHYRTSTGHEVDFILQDRQQRVVGIEVKASAHIGADAFKGLRHLRDMVGPQFHRGIVLHPGTQTVAFDPQLAAVPLQALWTPPK
jgi:predicted AAA+ superfamily ATPase